MRPLFLLRRKVTGRYVAHSRFGRIYTANPEDAKRYTREEVERTVWPEAEWIVPVEDVEREGKA